MDEDPRRLPPARARHQRVRTVPPPADLAGLLFHDHVGVGPKWVIRRYRLHEVTELMAAGGSVRWAEVAAELGYADQAHLSRDFTRMFGEPPTSYARRY